MQLLGQSWEHNESARENKGLKGWNQKGEREMKYYLLSHEDRSSTWQYLELKLLQEK